MLQTDLLAPAHADLVTHLTYDYYGERLATCSADQRIKVFRKDENGKWAEEANWKAHDAPILHLSFSHPIHGSLLASCSHDRTIRIWEEPSTAATAAAAAAAASFSSSRSPPTVPSATSASISRAWLERGILTGPTGAIRSVQFGPPDPAFGLRVASIATDGYLRVHTSLDPSLNDWSEILKVHVPSLPGPSSSGPGGAASGDDGTGGTPSSSTGGTGLAGTLALASNTVDGGSTTSHHPNTSELATGGWGLSWCKERWWGPLIAVFAGTSPSIKLISLSPTPSCVLLLTPSSPTTTATTTSTTAADNTTSSIGPTQYAPLTCLAWAPNCGRNYHLLATGARDGTIRIWRVEPPGERGRVDYDTEGEMVKEWRGQCTGEFGKGGARVGTVDWNAAGTMLSTTDDEGIVRIYKPTYARSWSLLGSLAAEEPPLEDGLNGH
ncbi:nucleoporin SEH1 [Cryptococcus gattii E566]|uniref:Nuclear pore protein seh1, putative n=2 Tax=Cryptococcus gattii TaxID=37769 RepID=E6R1G9_CRYGW|nr:Nuclear pore protein seh1, putative [Cryptococcus gattii WM276]ADV20676.1 Nuclear pore protein seh1, putative [Cryptococcus gattii WM276]KIR76829.1 nucleoporin SEH1 [Cryptococcus gattii EJB2]KIY31212.1 nucleoporin SEH1 [Cryptococcus gattii E566]KJE01442.1 nucleoporin SEH1 [Cryptococcus gattii NT-10]